LSDPAAGECVCSVTVKQHFREFFSASAPHLTEPAKPQASKTG
jgi:hypothetical protein